MTDENLEILSKNLSDRTDKLEANQDEILSVLKKIEKRLIGNIEEDKPGLIDDMRALRRTVESIDTRMIMLEKSDMVSRVAHLEETAKDLSTKVENLNKYKLMAYGGIVVGVFLLEKLWTFFKK